MVLQAYWRQSEQALAHLIDFAKKRGSPIAIRLVKGAYWDQEVVSAMQHGWDVPVFEVKEHSDAHYEHLSRMLIDNHSHVLPAFGSHNVRSLSHACCYAESKGLNKDQFELQMLYGMAEPIARAFSRKDYLVRLYVPLGEMLPGMGYLVRRLLENTSNESFLRHTFVNESEITQLLKKPDPNAKRSSANTEVQ
jgi:RHH-type proline utilization regulon transcriptional repressor/proline dehydrogenase/delta 1-pyrroline-5-carboxylate dehydrogenase